MKKLLTVFLFIPFYQVLPADLIITTSINEDKSSIDTFTDKDTGKEITKRYYDQNDEFIKSTGNLPDGEYKIYNSENTLIRERTYKNNQPDGQAVDYNNDGSIDKYSFKNGEINGFFQRYKNGKLLQSTQYVNGQRNGEAVIYTSSGEIESTAFFVNDELNGTAKEYIDGKLHKAINYKNGELEGELIIYYKKEELNKYIGSQNIDPEADYIYSKCTVKQGKLNGKCYSYYINGNIETIETYVNDIIHGERKIYYEDKVLGYEANFVNGKPEGIVLEYYPNGDIRYKDTYKNGVKINRKAYDVRGKLDFSQDY